MCGSQGARLPLQRPHQSESRTRLQLYNSSDRTAAASIPAWHTALAVGRIVDPRFPSFQKPAALVVGRPVVLAHDPLHAASLERTQRPPRHPRGRAVTGRRNCSRETDSRIASGGRWWDRSPAGVAFLSPRRPSPPIFLSPARPNHGGIGGNASSIWSAIEIDCALFQIPHAASNPALSTKAWRDQSQSRQVFPDLGPEPCAAQLLIYTVLDIPHL